jgi:hypothetical protein
MTSLVIIAILASAVEGTLLIDALVATLGSIAWLFGATSPRKAIS